jgi:transcriptional regulator with XRE-family HTH domain
MLPSAIQYRAARVLLELSQEDAAARVGVSVRTLITVEQGGGSKATRERVMGGYLGLGIDFTMTKDGSNVTVGLRRR